MMDFQQSSQTLRSRLHLGDLNTSTLTVLGVFVVLILAIPVGILLVNNTSSAFEVISHEEREPAVGTTDSGEDELPAKTISSLAVYVCGAVNSPGLVELTDGSRVNDALQAAGGFSENADKNSVNLARVVTDGEQVMIPALGEDDPAENEPSTQEQSHLPNSSNNNASASSASFQGKVNINTATVAELTTLKGIGSATAQKIINERESHGQFKTVDDLTRVSGIGSKKLEALRDSITVG